jgi:hypothetical protein
MAKAILVEQDIHTGRAVIDALDRARFPVVAALWDYADSDPDGEGVWRFIIATRRVFEWGHTKTYRTIQDILRNSSVGHPLDYIHALSSDDPFVTMLRVYAGTDGAPFIGDRTLKSTAQRLSATSSLLRP